MSGRARAKSRSPPRSHHDAGLTIMFGGKDLQAKEGLMRLRSQTSDHAPQLLDAAGVAAILDHLVDARGAQSRVLLQHFAHKRQVGIDNGGPQRLGVLEAFHFNGAPHGVGVDIQSSCNRADFPVISRTPAARRTMPSDCPPALPRPAPVEILAAK